MIRFPYYMFRRVLKLFSIVACLRSLFFIHGHLIFFILFIIYIYIIHLYTYILINTPEYIYIYIWLFSLLVCIKRQGLIISWKDSHRIVKVGCMWNKTSSIPLATKKFYLENNRLFLYYSNLSLSLLGLFLVLNFRLRKVSNK